MDNIKELKQKIELIKILCEEALEKIEKITNKQRS